MSAFPEQLKLCRKNAKITQRKMAEHLKISERAYQHYELGSREPGFDLAIKIADYFDVSLDYLVGRSGHPARH